MNEDLNEKYRKIFHPASERILRTFDGIGAAMFATENLSTRFLGAGAMLSKHDIMYNQMKRFENTYSSKLMMENLSAGLLSYNKLVGAGEMLKIDNSAINKLYSSFNNIRAAFLPGEGMIKQLEVLRKSLILERKMYFPLDNLHLSDNYYNIDTHYKWADILENSAKIFTERFQSINFEDVSIDEDGNIAYMNEEVSVNATLEIIDNLMRSTSSIVEFLQKHIKNFTLIQLLLVYLYIFIPFISMSVTQSKDVLNDKSIQDINDGISSGLNKLGQALISVQTLASTSYKELNRCAQDNPIIYDLIKACFPGLFYFVIKKMMEYKPTSNDKNKYVKGLKRFLFKAVREEYNSNFTNVIFLNNFGIIKIKSLDVRVSGQLKAPIIYKLSLGEVVTIVERQKDWTKVFFQGKDEVNYTGWVFSRYISKYSLK